MSWLTKIPRDKLKLLYLNKKLGSRKIAEEFNCGKSAILKRLHQYNIPLRKAKIRIDIPKNRLEYLYLDKTLSIYKIAEIFNTNQVTILNRMREYGIPARSISEALKGQIPWNKGKNLPEKTRRKIGKISKERWSDPEYRKKMEIYAKKTSERMKGDKNPMKNQETREKVRKKMKGRLIGDENPAKKLKVRRKIRRALKAHIVLPGVKKKIAKSLTGRYAGKLNPFYGKHHTKKVKEKSRIRAIEQLISGKFNNRITSIELKIEKELRKRNLYYKKQFPLLNRTVIDFYLPQHKVVIYCDGTFWHKSRWAEKQGVKEKDRKQTKLLSNKGYKVFRFPEIKINNSLEKCIDKVTKYINQV
jgi:very-short-patch-repair endonuclease